MRRLASVARSPVYAGFSEALEGAPTIRGFSAQGAFSTQNITALGTLQRANYAGPCMHACPVMDLVQRFGAVVWLETT